MVMRMEMCVHAGGCCSTILVIGEITLYFIITVEEFLKKKTFGDVSMGSLEVACTDDILFLLIMKTPSFHFRNSVT